MPYGITPGRVSNVLLFCLAHPRWQFVFQPKYAAYLNLIEPSWKTLRSLALKGRRFETWDEVQGTIRRPRATGMTTGIRLCGGDDGINHVGNLASHLSRKLHRTYRMNHLARLYPFERGGAAS